MGDLADPSGRKKGQGNKLVHNLNGGGLDEANQPSVITDEDGGEYAGCRRAPWQTGLGNVQRLRRTVQLCLSGTVHVDLNQEVGHGAIVAGRNAPGHLGQH